MKQLPTSGNLSADGDNKPFGLEDYIAPVPKMDYKYLENAGIMKRFYNTSFDSIAKSGIPANTRQQYNIAKRYASELKENIKNGLGMILCGPCGTMKTSLAIAILRSQLESGEKGLFVPMCSLIDNLFTKRALSKEDWASYEQRIRNTPLLILDDLGAENTDQTWILSKIDSIITERYNRMRPIIITSNMLPFSQDKNEQTMQNTYGARVFDRLKSTSELVIFNGQSLRKPVEVGA